MSQEKTVYTANESSLNSMRFIIESTVKIGIKTNILDHITDRLIVLQDTLNDTEYDYCEQLGRIKELRELAENINNIVTESKETNKQP